MGPNDPLEYLGTMQACDEVPASPISALATSPPAVGRASPSSSDSAPVFLFQIHTRSPGWPPVSTAHTHLLAFDDTPGELYQSWMVRVSPPCLNEALTSFTAPE